MSGRAELGAAPSRRPVRAFLILAMIVLPIQIGGALTARMITDRESGGGDYTYFYLPAAQSMAHGLGPLVDGKVLTRHPPGYPAYLAGLVLISESTGVPMDGLVVGCNFLWNLATMAGVFLLAYRLGGARLGAAAAVLVGICPHVFFLSRAGYSQIPCWAILAWAIYSAYLGHCSGRLVWFALAGFLLGLGALMRPDVLLLAAILPICVMVSSRHRLRARPAQGVLLLAVFTLTVSPWIIYLYDATGRVMLLTHQTITVATVHNDRGAVAGLSLLAAWAADPLSYSLELVKRAAMAWYHADPVSEQIETREAVALASIVPYLVLTVLGFAVGFRKRDLLPFPW